jgi:ADP-heptose:LPS heptosyltransferase
MNILVVQLGSNGDCMFVTTIAKQFKEIDYPDCNLTWMIGALYSTVIENNIFVDDKIIINSDTLQDLINKRKKIVSLFLM